jgi:hypothetical protein
MNTTSVENAFSLTIMGEPVAGDFTWQSDDTKLIFTPAGNLKPHTQYRVTVNMTFAEDKNGTHLSNNGSNIWEFITTGNTDDETLDTGLCAGLLVLMLLMFVVVLFAFLKGRDYGTADNNKEKSHENIDKKKVSRKGVNDDSKVKSDKPKEPEKGTGTGKEEKNKVKKSDSDDEKRLDKKVTK